MDIIFGGLIHTIQVHIALFSTVPYLFYHLYLQHDTPLQKTTVYSTYLQTPLLWPHLFPSTPP
jgi:hypothetical protein